MVVLGGPQSALDDEATSPELVPVRDLLRQALAADFPTLAICLGAQLLAQVGGGTVRPGIDGPEVGATLVAKRDAADADPVFGPLPLSPDVIQFHHDEIAELPDRARRCWPATPSTRTRPSASAGTSTGCSSTSRRRRRSSHEWAERDVVGVAASPHDRETICLLSDAAHPDIAEAWAPFAGRFADLVRARARQAA